MLSQVHGVTKEELCEEIMLGIQERAKPGIYYISEFYLGKGIKGKQTTSRGQTQGDLDVEEHLKPLFHPTTMQQEDYSGNVPITVDFYDIKGNYYTETIEIYLEVDAQSNVEEFLIEYIEKSYEDLSRQGRNQMYAGNNGDLTVVAYGTYLYQDFTFLTDKETFLKLLTDTYKDNFVTLENESTEKKLARVHRDIKRKSNREGNITVIGVKIESISRPRVMEKNVIFLDVKYTYRLEFEGKFPSDVTTSKIAIFEGDPSNLSNAFNKYVLSIRKSLTTAVANATVGIFMDVGESGVRYGQLKIKNELPHFNRVNHKKTRTILFNNERSFAKYLKDVTRYIEDQHFKYKDDTRYLAARDRFKGATLESQQFNKTYNDIQGNITIHLRNNYLLHIGTHYAILDNQLGEYKLLYNLFDERLSIIEAKERVYKYGSPVQTYVEKVLDILDGRRSIEGPELDEVFGVR